MAQTQPKHRKIEDLRETLFQTIDNLLNEEKPMDLDRAKMVALVADKLIDSARVEVDFLRVTGGIEGTEFIPDGKRQLTAGRNPAGEKTVGGKEYNRRLMRVSQTEHERSLAGELLPSIRRTWWLREPARGIVLDYDLVPSGILTIDPGGHEMFRLASYLDLSPALVTGRLPPSTRCPHVVLRRSKGAQEVWLLEDEVGGGRLDLSEGFLAWPRPLPRPDVFLAVARAHERRRPGRFLAVAFSSMKTL